MATLIPAGEDKEVSERLKQIRRKVWRAKRQAKIQMIEKEELDWLTRGYRALLDRIRGEIKPPRVLRNHDTDRRRPKNRDN
jgi:hypothetical protein